MGPALVLLWRKFQKHKLVAATAVLLGASYWFASIGIVDFEDVECIWPSNNRSLCVPPSILQENTPAQDEKDQVGTSIGERNVLPTVLHSHEGIVSK